VLYSGVACTVGFDSFPGLLVPHFKAGTSAKKNSDVYIIFSSSFPISQVA
jgi:hypothetical protein